MEALDSTSETLQETGFAQVAKGKELFDRSDEKALKEKGFQIFIEGVKLILSDLKSKGTLQILLFE